MLSETANVVDLPLIPPGEPYVPAQFSYTSFDFYHVDEDALLASSLLAELGKADYILVPSRRIYMNYTCERPDGIRTQNYQSAHCRALRNRYPILNDYYRQLFDGSLGYRPEAMFTRYPTLSLFGLRIWEFPDERAEEAWSVFDHPVVRIYKRGGQ